MANLTVKLNYYKKTGKWYASGKFLVRDDKDLHKIWNQVKLMMANGYLPGLVQSSEPYEYIVSVDVPGHKHEHPHLIIP